MVEFDRETFKNEEWLKKIYDVIVKKHKVAKHTICTLVENRGIKDFCEESRHFSIMNLSDNTNIYLHYDISSWLKELRVVVTIDKITIYNDFMEYEKNRIKQLHGADQADIPNIN